MRAESLQEIVPPRRAFWRGSNENQFARQAARAVKELNLS